MPGTALCIGLVYPHDHSGRPRLFFYPHSTDEDSKATGPTPLSWEMEMLGTDPATGSPPLSLPGDLHFGTRNDQRGQCSG